MGLRVQIFSTVKNITQELKNSWENVLNKCSKEYMQLLLIQYQLDINLLDQELAMLNSQYEQIKCMPSLEARIRNSRNFWIG